MQNAAPASTANAARKAGFLREASYRIPRNGVRKMPAANRTPDRSPISVPENPDSRLRYRFRYVVLMHWSQYAQK
jgi:hypothetical protein